MNTRSRIAISFVMIVHVVSCDGKNSGGTDWDSGGWGGDATASEGTSPGTFSGADDAGSDDDGHANGGGNDDGDSFPNEELPDDFDPATERTSSTGITVSYVTDPTPIPESTEFSITFTIDDGTITEADATMPTHGGHGMAVTPSMTANGDGTYTAAPFAFHMPGYWVIHVVVEDDGGIQERLDFDVACCE